MEGVLERNQFGEVSDFVLRDVHVAEVRVDLNGAEHSLDLFFLKAFNKDNCLQPGSS